VRLWHALYFTEQTVPYRTRRLLTYCFIENVCPIHHGHTGKHFTQCHQRWRVVLVITACLAGMSWYLNWKRREFGRSLKPEARHLEAYAVLAQLCRWHLQVQLFFKLIKQHLRFKALSLKSAVAVRSQLWSAVSVIVFDAIVKKRLAIKSLLYTIILIFS
jgi:hypothetical protein